MRAAYSSTSIFVGFDFGNHKCCLLTLTIRFQKLCTPNENFTTMKNTGWRLILSRTRFLCCECPNARAQLCGQNNELSRSYRSKKGSSNERKNCVFFLFPEKDCIVSRLHGFFSLYSCIDMDSFFCF